MERSLLRLAYLVSRYPAVSHSFILREVSELRALGVQVEVASINSPDRGPENLTALELVEAQKTFYVKRAGIWRAAAAQFPLIIASPARYLGALCFALRLARADVQRLWICFFYFIEAVMVAKWMQKNSLTHLHVHFATPAATVALILTRLAQVGMSITVHGPDEFYDVPGHHLSEKITTARFICAIGVYARSQLMKIAPASQWEKFEVVPLGVDPNIYKPKKSHCCSVPFEVLCVGRLVPSKGQHILLLAAARLISLGRSVLIRLVGEGPDRRSLESEAERLNIADSVRFEGALNQDETYRLYETADAFALASFAEGIPVVLMEAMAMEIPCVTTWITGIPELIRSELDGLLVPPSDVEGLCSALVRLMDDAELRLRIGKAGRIRVEERYNLSRNVRQLAEVFSRRLGVQV